ncbi:MAG: sorbosone dehydrogenase family protein [Methyloglobulus sp.]|nr:sorbosone dehydrogenase family protein [Methyloglobulus sp.]
MTFAKTIILSLLISNTAGAFAQSDKHQELIKNLHVPEGFRLTVFAENVANARSLALGDNGIVFVGTGAEGAVYALEDKDKDGFAERRYDIANNLYMPNGVAYKDGSLYVAEINRIIRFDHLDKAIPNLPKPMVVYDKLPSDKHHGWKYLRFGPDGKLYTAIGAPCNICNPDKPYASLLRLNRNGSDFEIIATGIRNTVGFDWQPETEALFFTDNGRDLLGDDVPPEELNQWSKVGEHFGYPYCHAGKVSDPEFGKEKPCSEFTAPTWTFKAHIAPLGIRFYRGNQFPSHYKNQLFVAQHGSWNRTKPDGYRIVLVRFKQGKPVSDEVFIDGWLQKDDNTLGRPVDILEMPDGSLLISDDQTGIIYKVEYQGKS